MIQALNDMKKFEEVIVNKKTHSITAKERSIAYYIRKYFKGYDEKLIQKLVPSGSASGKIYDLEKVHEKDNKFRPVVSTVGTHKYKLAKFLYKIIKPYIPNSYMFGVSFLSCLEQARSQKFAMGELVLGSGGRSPQRLKILHFLQK